MISLLRIWAIGLLFTQVTLPPSVQILGNPQSDVLDIFELPQTTHLLVAKGRGYFPSLNRIGSEMFAIFRSGGGFYGRQGFLEMAESSEAGRVWSPVKMNYAQTSHPPSPKIVANSPNDDRYPASGVSESGRILCVYQEDAGYDTEGNYIPDSNNKSLNVVFSEDFGKNWSDPKPLGVAGLETATPYGAIRATADGTLTLSLYGAYTPLTVYASNQRPQAENHIYVVQSQDGGETWGETSLVASGHSQCAILPLDDRRVLAVARSDSVRRLNLLRSTDGGRTWSRPLRLTGFDQAPGDLIRLSNGWLLLLFADQSREFSQIAGLVSKDGGITWELQNRCIFSRPVEGRIGAPNAIRLPDGRVALMYYWDGQPQTLYDASDTYLSVNYFNESEWLQTYESLF